MKCDQDLCLNLRYDFGKMNSTLGSVVPLAMFLGLGHIVLKSLPFWLALVKLGRDMRETCPDGVVI